MPLERSFFECSSLSSLSYPVTRPASTYLTFLYVPEPVRQFTSYHVSSFCLIYFASASRFPNNYSAHEQNCMTSVMHSVESETDEKQEAFNFMCLGENISLHITLTATVFLCLDSQPGQCQSSYFRRLGRLGKYPFP